MINPPPPDDWEEQEALAQNSSQNSDQPSQQEEYHPQESSSFYGSESYDKEPSGFGFVALVASLISLTVFGGIVIYNVLLAPSAPRQPILIEAEGATKSVPSDAQVKPEPNSDVGVFRMLRGAGRDGERKNGEEQSSSSGLAPTTTPNVNSGVNSGINSGRSLNLKAEPSQQAEAGTKVESITATPESGDARENAKSEKPVANEEADAKSADDAEERGESRGESVAKKEDTQEAVTPAAKTAVKGSWYVQVAALESRSAADSAWTRLHDRMPELLYTQKYIAKEAKLASGRKVWRLLLGPQAQDEAATLCRALQSRAQSCIVKRLDK